MKRLIIILALLLSAVVLSGCSVLEASSNSQTAKANAARAEAYAQVETARQAAVETQAIQATAQVSQIEASNRLMAFLATVVTLSQNPMVYVTLLIAGGLAFSFGLLAAAFARRPQ